MVLIPSSLTLLKTGTGCILDEADVVTSSVSSRFLCSVSTISDNSKPELASSIKSHKLGYYSYQYPWQAKCQLLNLFTIFPVIQKYLGHNPANKKIVHSLSDFRLALLWLLIPLWIQSSLFLISELHLLIEVFIEIHDILDMP